MIVSLSNRLISSCSVLVLVLALADVVVGGSDGVLISDSQDTHLHVAIRKT
jgi:hypothetical protein